MIAMLRLEAIGDAYRPLQRAGFRGLLKRMGRIPRAHASAVLDNSWRPWVARLQPDARGGFERTFERGLRDYRDASGNGNRGVYLTFILRPVFIYDVRELLSWSRDRRYFCRVEAGKIVEMSVDEVHGWFAERTNPIQHIINQARRL